MLKVSVSQNADAKSKQSLFVLLNNLKTKFLEIASSLSKKSLFAKTHGENIQTGTAMQI